MQTSKAMVASVGIRGRNAMRVTAIGKSPHTATMMAMGITSPAKAMKCCCISVHQASARRRRVGSRFQSPLAYTCMKPKDQRVRCLTRPLRLSGVSSRVTRSAE